MNPTCRLLLASLLSVTATAQEPTLRTALQTAELVVTARVVAVSDPSPDWHRLDFVVVAAVVGQAPATLQVLEPAGACCGRSLFALQVGDERLLFLRRVGPHWHPHGGAAGVLPAAPALLAHVAGLRAAVDPRALVRTLVEALASEEPRVADDAAATLALLPASTLVGLDHAAVAGALQQALAVGHTRSAPLADVAVRSGDAALLDAVVAAYVAEPAADRARLLRHALRRADPAVVTHRAPALVHGDAAALRLAELFRELPGMHGEQALVAMLPRAHPRVALCAVEGLLARGARVVDLVPFVPATVLELAEQNRRRPARFRAIEPSRR
jgi:hypothetical protein